MIVLDTHVWLWMTAAPNRLSRDAHAAIGRSDRLGVCTISCWELAMLVAAGRIRVEQDINVWVRQALAADRVEAVPLTAGAAVAAAQLPVGFPGDPADRIIYATAVGLGVPLISRDARISSFDPHRVVW